MTDQTDFDGCRRACRLAGAHTLVSGECEQAPEPEPTVSLSRVFTDTDGHKSIGFDTYTVDQLAELLDPVLGSEAMRARKGSVDLAHLAAHTIIHRNDDPAVSSAGPAPDTDRDTLRERIAAALLDHLSRTADIRPGRNGDPAFMPEITDGERMRIAEHLAAVLPAPTDQTAVLLEAADIAEDVAIRLRGECLLDQVNGAYEVMSELRRRAGEAQQAPTDEDVVEAHRLALSFVVRPGQPETEA